jgi:hypothetical protein
MTELRSLALGLVLLALAPFSASAQCLKNDCIDGYGEYRFPDRTIFYGEFKGGRIADGVGTLIFPDGGKYLGNFKQQVRQGTGRLITAQGDEYLGNFHQNRKHGQGTMRYANGNIYEGNWNADEPEGVGEMRFANGDRYVGEFRAGEFFGNGRYFYVDGSRYEGGWKNNAQHGKGVLILPNDQQLAGQWLDGQFQMDWRSLAVEDTGDLPDCTTQDCRNGQGRFVYSDGTKYVGAFVEGQPLGQGSAFYPNGDRYDGNWSAHRPNGLGVRYYADGRIVGAVWRNGKPERILFENTGKPATDIQVDRDPRIKIWAVIVGAARYRAMPSLRYTDDDAYQVYAFLKSPEGGALPDEQVRLLIDEDATHRNIIQAMRQTFLRADENDVVLFYFSGHGLQGAFLPVDYDGIDNRLEHYQIRDALIATRAKHKLVLADACHSGSLLEARVPVHETLKRYYEAFDQSAGGTALLLSSKSEEYSLEDGGLRSGIFSHYLIRGLKGEADMDGDKLVTIVELFGFVHEQVRRYTGNIQTPTLTGDFDPRMPVGVIRE